MKKLFLLLCALLITPYIFAQQIGKQLSEEDFKFYVGDTTEQGLVKSIKNLIDKSEIIMDAEIISKECKWIDTEDKFLTFTGGRDIYTILTFKVHNWIKGPITGDVVNFLCWGGTIGDTSITSSSTPTYPLNQRNIYGLLNKEPNTFIEHCGIIPISTNGEGLNATVRVGLQTTNAEFYVKQLQKAVIDFTTYEKYIHQHKMQERNLMIRKQKIKNGTLGKEFQKYMKEKRIPYPKEKRVPYTEGEK